MQEFLTLREPSIQEATLERRPPFLTLEVSNWGNLLTGYSTLLRFHQARRAQAGATHSLAIAINCSMLGLPLSRERAALHLLGVMKSNRTVWRRAGVPEP